MNRWYFITPQDVLLSGNSDVIEGYINDSSSFQSLMAQAKKSYISDSGITFADFLYPFVSAVAGLYNQTQNMASSPEFMEEIIGRTGEITQFDKPNSGNDGFVTLEKITSLGQVISFLSPVLGQNISAEKIAMHFYNSIVAEKFTVYGNEKIIAEKITDAFLSRELLQYPQDKAALGDVNIINKLPAIMRFMLAEHQIKQKSFERYLRKGITPDISKKILREKANKQKLPSTFSLEFDFEVDVPSHVYGGGLGRGRKGEENFLQVLTIIYEGMLNAERSARKAADEHLLAFDGQIREKFGIIPKLSEESYLEMEIKRFELQLLQTLERILIRVEKLFLDKTVKYYDLSDFDIKAAFDKNEPILPQVEDRVLYETSHMKGRLKQALDKDRQQNIGISKYIWRSQDDDKVRSDHAENDDKIFEWDNPPATGHPGEAYNCRCYAEPVADDIKYPDAIEPIYPELLLFPVAKSIRFIAQIVTRTKDKVDELQDGQPPPQEQPEQLPQKLPDDDEIFKRPDGVPEDWIKKPANKQDGVRYTDPENIHNEVRIQRGRPSSDFPSQQKDYAKWKKNGQWLDKNANPVSGKSPESHIPLEEFDFNEELFK